MQVSQSVEQAVVLARVVAESFGLLVPALAV